MHFAIPAALILQVDIWEMVRNSGPVAVLILVILIGFSVFSWAVVFAKLSTFRGAQRSNARFLRAFRKANGLEAVMVASEQYRPSPLVAVFDFGYEEVERQVKSRGKVCNRTALERSLQLGISEELAKLERNMHWLAITASICPFIGLLGTVMGIIGAFHGLGQEGATTLRTIGPGIAQALIATAIGLFAAVPAVLLYNFLVRRNKIINEKLRSFASDLQTYLITNKK